MMICGLKLTHDGGIALIDGHRLVFSIEMEKLGNNRRHQPIGDLDQVAAVLREQGYALSDLDDIVVDGWGAGRVEGLTAGGAPFPLRVAPYREPGTVPDGECLVRHQPGDLLIEGRRHPYASYAHLTNHALGAYMTSRCAARHESSLVLVWDGGCYPCLYHVDAAARRLTFHGRLMDLYGNIYTVLGQRFPPFRKAEPELEDLSIAGKLMAYVACGEVREDLFALFDACIAETAKDRIDWSLAAAARIESASAQRGFAGDDVLRSFHVHVGLRLRDALSSRLTALDLPGRRNLCISGGCALNIKWNSDLRRADMFDHVWVPPFPNDSGSAIGAAASALYGRTGASRIEWDVYAGPSLAAPAIVPGWRARPCSLSELAAILFREDEPVVFLNGRAEAGPRALGNRSILASPFTAGMKRRLNEMKGREQFRPVAPICLEDEAPTYFDPGTPDPYMVFDHQVRPSSRARIQAVLHLDGSSRLQTLSRAQNAVVHQLLQEFRRISGVGMLCNTSANLNGRGFFPDVRSAMRWGKVRYVWSDGVLYVNDEAAPATTIAGREPATDTMNRSPTP